MKRYRWILGTLIVVVAALDASLLPACGLATKPPSSAPPAPAIVRPLAVHTCVPDAKVWLNGAGVPADLDVPRSADASGAVTYLIFPGTVADFNVHAAAKNHNEYGVVVHGVRSGSDGVDLFFGDCEKNARGYPQALQLDSWPALETRRFPPESGSIHVCDNHYAFCDQSGHVWDWRGASMFQLFGRFVAGEDITPQIRWMQAVGINTARIFVQWDGGTNRLDERSDFVAQLRAFIERFASEGLRLELVAIANWRTPEEDRPIVRQVYDAAAGHWNVFVEPVNEPWVRGYDVLNLMRGVDRHGVLTAYGYQPFSDCPTPDTCHWAITAKADYVTVHLPRDRAHYPRNSKDVLEMRVVGQPVVDDEPLGFAEYDKDGSGARWTDLDAHLSHFALCRLYCAGASIHTQAGHEGRAPRRDEPITLKIADAIGRAWAFIPADAILGGYGRNGLGDFPLSVTGSDTYDGQGHAYAAIAGGHGWLVVPKPTASWTPRLNGGWRIASVGPAPYILQVQR